MQGDGLLRLSLRDGQALYLIRVDPAEEEKQEEDSGKAEERVRKTFTPEEAWEEAKRRVRCVLKEFLGLRSCIGYVSKGA